MELIDVIQKIVASHLDNAGLTDYVIGTVTKISPLEITLISTMLPIPQDVLILTETVMEKKIPYNQHTHTMDAAAHAHNLPSTLAHDHVVLDDTGQPTNILTSESLNGQLSTDDTAIEAIISDSYAGLPVVNGYLIINPGLSIGDKVVMLRVMGGQNFIVLSRTV